MLVGLHDRLSAPFTLRPPRLCCYRCCMYNTNSAAPDAPRRALWEDPCLAARIRRVHRVVTRTYDDALRGCGLTAAQLDVLMTLLTAGRGMRRIDLARALEMERSTVTRNLDRLAARGLVASTPAAGELRVVVTPTGRAAAERAAGAWFEAQQATRTTLGEEGVAALQLLTDRLTAHHQD